MLLEFNAMATKVKNLPLVLLILDGWGIAPASRGNAFTGSKIPIYNQLIRNYKTFSLAAAGEAVGLPWGEPGNSEVGHLNLGAGKIVYQPVLKINKAIEDKTFLKNEQLLGAIEHCKKNNSSLHLMGLLSDGGVHSHQDHLYALLEMAAKYGLRRVYVHVFLDGRDTAFNSGLYYVKQLEKVMKQLGVGRIATVAGRFFAMDRDNNWDRAEKVYRAMVNGEAEKTYESAVEAVNDSYANKIYDEEFKPCLIKVDSNAGTSRVQTGDSLIFYNYRPDRARQLSKAFALPTFDKFNRPDIGNTYFVTLVEYDPDLPVKVAFIKDLVETPVGKVWSDAGLSQLHVAETEKYAHVTYFFNGGKNTTFKGETDKIVPSAGVASYADKPEMSVGEIKKQTLEALKKNEYDCYVINFANADMVGHTGDIRATQIGLECVDKAVKELATQTLKMGGVMVVTADHGNAEEMVNWENGEIIKEHSRNPVPCLLIGEDFRLREARAEIFLIDSIKITGILSDVTPTLLAILGLEIPSAMTSRPLI